MTINAQSAPTALPPLAAESARATNSDRFGREFALSTGNVHGFCTLATAFYTPRNHIRAANRPPAATRGQSRFAPPPSRPRRLVSSPITRESAPSPDRLPQDPPPPAPSDPLSNAGAQPLNPLPEVALRRASPPAPAADAAAFDPFPAENLPFLATARDCKQPPPPSSPIKRGRLNTRPFATLRGSSLPGRPRLPCPVAPPNSDAIALGNMAAILAFLGAPVLESAP